MPMDKSAADSYVYAKASGMLAKSYVGEKARVLFSFHTLQELWSFLFKKEIPVVPETLLAKALEVEAFNVFLRDFVKLVENYAVPERILLALIQEYDYANLKDISAALSLGEKNIPDLQRIEPFNIVDYEKWPDLQAMTSGGSLSWYNEVPSVSEQHLVSYKIDCQCVMSIWKAANKIHSSCRKAVLDLLGEKFRVDNCIWAIRLRYYYKMERDEITSLLAYSDERQLETDPLVVDAFEILDWDLESWEDWKGWKFSMLLNPHEDGAVWSVDPRWVLNAYKVLYVKKARKLFHRFPFTVCPMVCWFIIKRNEVDNIMTACESLRLNIDPSQAMKTAGVLEGVDA